MYIRQNDRRRSISIPQNYSGNAFSDDSEQVEEVPKAAAGEVDSDIARHESESSKNEERRSFLPISIGHDELILIGILLLLFQGEVSDGIIPLLLAILFLGS